MPGAIHGVGTLRRQAQLEFRESMFSHTMNSDCKHFYVGRFGYVVGWHRAPRPSQSGDRAKFGQRINIRLGSVGSPSGSSGGSVSQTAISGFYCRRTSRDLSKAQLLSAIGSWARCRTSILRSCEDVDQQRGITKSRRTMVHELGILVNDPHQSKLVDEGPFLFGMVS